MGIKEIRDGLNPIDPLDRPVSSTGPALKARRDAITQCTPLGPPDLLYLRKRYVPVVGAPKQYGYYHFVRGLAPSSVAEISAYIVQVIRNNGLDPQSWVSTGGWDIASATFVAYNIMARADVVLHVDFPGGTAADAFDRNGNPVYLNDLFWHQLHVSSVIRDYSSSGEQPLYPCLRVISSSSPLQVEEAFLNAATQCVQTWHLSGSQSSDDACILASKSRIAFIIRNHFLDFARFETAITFFMNEHILEFDPLCALHAAVAARRIGDLDQASSIVDQVIEKCPESDIAWMERANIFRAQGNLPKALEFAKTAASFAAENVMFWAWIADLYADLKEHSNSLKALNCARIPSQPIDHYLRVLLPQRDNCTTPVEGASNGTDAVAIFAKRMREERIVSNHRTDDILFDLPAKTMHDTDHVCYAVLVKVLNDLNWDHMLAVRGECFVMETDIESGKVENRFEDGVLQSNGALTEENSTNPSDSATTNGMANISLDGDGSNVMDEEATNGSSPKEEDVLVNARKRSLEKIGKKVCKPWLDYLVTNMYNDLRAMAVWKAEEAQLTAAASLTIAALSKKVPSEISEGSSSRGVEEEDMEAQERDHPARRAVEEIVTSTQRPPADWLRRGELSLRLGKIEEAKSAFVVCVKVAEKEKQTALTALCRLMSMASHDGDIRTTIRCANAVWTFMDVSTDRKLSSETTLAVTDVRKSVFNLISAKGLSAVREVLVLEVIRDSVSDVDKKRLEGLLLDAVALRVDGFVR